MGAAHPNTPINSIYYAREFDFGFLVYKKMWRPPSARKIIVLIGEKLHKALYPKRDTLLADSVGINVTKARIK